MKPDDVADQVQARLTESVSLCVGRLVDEGLNRERLAIDSGAADALRAQAVPVVERLRTGGAMPYTAGNELDDDEYFLVDDADTLDDLAPFRILAAELGSMPLARPADLDASVGLTVTGFGDEDARRVVAVQKADPRLKRRLRPRGCPLGDSPDLTPVRRPRCAETPAIRTDGTAQVTSGPG